ncbi:MAG: SNF2-related protein, partial [Nitrospirae bacterium]|nr:SNF2-related protein [Nitrospirota bacterium]
GMFVERLRLTPDIETVRHRLETAPDKNAVDDALLSAPLMDGSEYLIAEVLVHKWNALNNEFKRQIKAYKGTVEEFIHEFSPQTHLLGRVYFHLVENKKGDSPFAFLATYSTSIAKDGKSRHLPLKYALEEFKGSSKKLLDLLTTVRFAAKESPFISGLLEGGDLFHPLAWSQKEAYTFLKEIPIYENAGILCRMPDWWKGASSAVRLKLSIGGKQPSFVGLDALVDFVPEFAIDGETISEEDARRLLESSEGLAFIKNKWVAVDPERLRQTLAIYEEARGMMESGDFSLKDALRLQMSPSNVLHMPEGNGNVEVTNGAWLESVVQRLRDPDFIDYSLPDSGFNAELRPYQQRGVNWLCFHHSLKFGACLADDMGLGKTVQVLAFLHILKTKSQSKASLLIVPASLLSNWQNELNKFAPQLRYFIAHPDMQPDKDVKPKDKGALDSLDLVITTYSLLQKYEWLYDYQWNYVVIDEAQAIKNPAAKQT